MNSLPLTLPQGNLPPINLNDFVVQFVKKGMQKMMRGGVSEVEMLKGWIVQGNVADLAEHLPTEHGKVAQLCLDMVEGHPKEVMVLLWDREVVAEAMKLMREMGRSDAPDAQKKAFALAQAVLDVGHEMDVTSSAWPAGVSELLQERRKASQDYSAHQAAKFDGVSLKGGLVIFRSAEVPFLSKRTGKSTENFSDGVMDESGKLLERRHLLEAVKDDRKIFLEQINLRKVSFAYEALETRCVNAQRLRAELAVQCTPESFGQLLAHMASRIPPGKSQAFDLSFSLAGDFGNVRDMVVFLEKTSEKGPMALKVSLYDAEVTGDMSHLRVLPEELVKLSFHDFDLRRAFKPGSIDLLNLMQDDWDLAISLRGRYIPRHSKIQVESMLNALAYGNLYGLQHAITELLTLHGLGVPIDDLNARSKDLALAFKAASVGGHVKVLKELEDSPLMLGSLTQITLRELMLAKRGVTVQNMQGVSAMLDLVQNYWARKLIAAGGDTGTGVKSTRPADPGELMPLTTIPLRSQGGVLNPVLGDVTDVFVRVFGKPRLSLAIWEIRDYLLGQAKERRIPLLQELKLPSNEVARLLRPDFGNLLQWALKYRDKNTIQAYLELVVLVQGSSSKLEKKYASGLLKRIRDICSPRSSWVVCCMRSDSLDFKVVVKSDRQLNALYALAEGSLKF